MFNRVRDFLNGSVDSLAVDKTGEPTDKDLQIAAGVLLLEMAGSDQDYAPEEVKNIFGAMKKIFAIEDDQDVLSILENAEALRADAKKIDTFVNAINSNFSAAQRQLLLSMVWRVAQADGKIEKFEERFATQLKFRLRLSDQEAADARKMASRPLT